MNRRVTVEKLKDWVVKNWLLLVLGVMGLVVLGVAGIQSLRRIKLSTPIASIEPEDSLEVENSASRLERYRSELEEMNKEHFRKKLAMEKIIAMDFGARSVDGKREEGGNEHVHTEKGNQPPQQKIGIENARVSKVTHRRKKTRNAPSQMEVEPPEKTDTNRLPFYTIKAEASPQDKSTQQTTGVNQLFKAVVDGDQKVFNNSTVSLRLLEEVKIGDQVFPRHTLVHGRLSGGSGGRLKISISSIREVPVKMLVYDQDYQEGIAYMRDEPVPSSLEEGRDQAFDELLYTIPYGGVFSGVAQAGRKMLQKNSRNKPLFLADGYPLFIGFERSNLK